MTSFLEQKSMLILDGMPGLLALYKLGQIVLQKLIKFCIGERFGFMLMMLLVEFAGSAAY